MHNKLCATFLACADTEGGRCLAPPSLDNPKATGFLSNTSPDPPKIIKLPSQHSVNGHHRPASETPFKWRFAGGPMMARFKYYLDLPTKKERC